jgi:hypothetical protein
MMEASVGGVIGKPITPFIIKYCLTNRAAGVPPNGQH